MELLLYRGGLAAALLQKALTHPIVYKSVIALADISGAFQVHEVLRNMMTRKTHKQGREDDRETHGAAIWKRTSKRPATPGEGCRNWLRAGVPGGVMLAAYAPEGAIKALIY